MLVVCVVMVASIGLVVVYDVVVLTGQQLTCDSSFSQRLSSQRLSVSAFILRGIRIDSNDDGLWRVQRFRAAVLRVHPSCERGGRWRMSS